MTFSSWLTPEILDDWGEQDRRHEENIESEVWDRVPTSDTFACRGPKCSQTRWMGWLDAARSFDAGWHSRLAAYIVQGLAQGWLSLDGKNLQLQDLVKKAGTAVEEPKKQKTGKHEDVLAQARKVAKNSMHITVYALLEPGFRGRCRMIIDLLQPPRLSTAFQLCSPLSLHCWQGPEPGTPYSRNLLTLGPRIGHGEL